ncbi:hypothetical protein LJC10_06345, partial [Selenomonadales bacterium OttesenSCG-928-I06]|nr:hypothetical protein [Selenomonadales bacterium OttesenSCG-928-I06]
VKRREPGELVKLGQLSETQVSGEQVKLKPFNHDELVKADVGVWDDDGGLSERDGVNVGWNGNGVVLSKSEGYSNNTYLGMNENMKGISENEDFNFVATSGTGTNNSSSENDSLSIIDNVTLAIKERYLISRKNYFEGQKEVLGYYPAGYEDVQAEYDLIQESKGKNGYNGYVVEIINETIDWMSDGANVPIGNLKLKAKIPLASAVAQLTGNIIDYDTISKGHFDDMKNFSKENGLNLSNEEISNLADKITINCIVIDVMISGVFPNMGSLVKRDGFSGFLLSLGLNTTGNFSANGLCEYLKGRVISKYKKALQEGNGTAVTKPVHVPTEPNAWDYLLNKK